VTDELREILFDLKKKNLGIVGNRKNSLELRLVGKVTEEN